METFYLPEVPRMGPQLTPVGKLWMTRAKAVDKLPALIFFRAIAHCAGRSGPC